MDLVFKDGRSYFVPSGTDNRITGVRKWEQAFRIYAAIYSQANPHRAAEIWQYVHIINTAASAYIWENMSYYDMTFRQLMAQNPLRSWAKIYSQMWSLAMRTPVTGNQNFNQYKKHDSYDSNHSNHNNGNNGKPSSKKPKHCWAYNRGNCKDGSKCKFVHRCSYCDSGTHIKGACPKKTV